MYEPMKLVFLATSYPHCAERFRSVLPANIGAANPPSQGLVNKERQLAGLQLEDKEWEAELWRNKFLKLQASTFSDQPHIASEDLLMLALQSTASLIFLRRTRSKM